MNHKSYIFSILISMLFLMLPPLTLRGDNGSTDLGLRTIVIDPGHGGKDPGAPGKTKATAEKHIVLSISKLFGNMIKEAYPEVKVVYTRSTDVFVELKERANIAKRNDADLFVSIHCNSNDNPHAFGASAHILGPKSNNPKNNSDYFAKSKSVAQRENSVMLLEDDYKTRYQDFDPDSPESVIGHSLMWQANYNNSLLFAAEYEALIHKSPYRESGYTGIHQDVFYLLWATNMPAALIELGFISNPSDYAVLSSADGQKKIAKSLFQAFSSYKSKFDASVGAVSASVKQPEAEKKEGSVVVTEEDDEVYYGVQIMGLGRLLKNGEPALKGLEVQAVKAEGSNIYKYVCGKHASQAVAQESLATVRKKFPDAFVVKVTGDRVERVK
jgi:N-acetylmuramoyl-L-alanine amidase